MARLLIYDAYENKVYTYNSLSENDPMPYSTGRTLTLREFRGRSNSPVLWTTIAAMEAWNLTRRTYGRGIPVGYAFRRIWEGGHGTRSQHYAGVAFDVSQMNTLSQRIGTTGSTWTDACGLDSGNTTTAVDMYLILRYLMSFDAFREISSAPTFTMPAKEKHAKNFVLVSQNVALNKTSGGKFYRSAMQGGICDVMAYKNDNGDQSYVSWANKNGATYIFCIMQSPDTCDDYGYANRRPALCETTKLIDWVFDSFSIQAALDTDQALAEIPVKYSSDTDTLQLYPDDNMMTLLPSSGDGTVTQKYFHLPDYAAAPIHQGDVIGTVELKLAGETIGVVNLIAGQDVRQNALLFAVSKVQDFFHSLYLKVVIVMSLLALAIYGLWWLLNVWHGRRPTKKIHRR